jgi:hypothetical protein
MTSNTSISSSPWLKTMAPHSKIACATRLLPPLVVTQRASQLLNALTVVLLAAFGYGCATPALWHGTAARQWRLSSPDQVLLFTSTNQQPDVAVVFTQFSANNGSPKSRCVVWCLGEPPTHLIIGTNAVRQFTSSLSGSRAVPLVRAGEAPPAPLATTPGHAVWSSPDEELTVHIEGVPPGPFTLPTAHERARTALRVVGLPFAVAADAVIGLGAIIVWAGPGLGAGAGP